VVTKVASIRELLEFSSWTLPGHEERVNADLGQFYIGMTVPEFA
jgi:hypothetical protein